MEAPGTEDRSGVPAWERLPGAAHVGGHVTLNPRLDGHILVVRGKIEGPLREVEAIELRHGPRILRTVVVNPDRSTDNVYHFGVRTSITTLPRAFDLNVTAKLVDGEHRNLARVRGSHRFSAPSLSDELQPLFVSGTPRSGTTLLMRVLAAHPQVGVVNEYPYESRHALVWGHTFAVQVSPADRRNSMTPQSLAESELWTGASPYFAPSHAFFDWLSGPYVERLARGTKELIEAFYREVAERTGKPGARYFAEKFPGVRLATLFQNLYAGTREVLLVRDLRDVLCSALAMNRRRGTQAFGVEEGVPEEELLRRMVTGLMHQYQSYCERWPAEARQIIRYEDLMREPARTVRWLLESLDLDATEATLDAILAAGEPDDTLRAEHMTSSGPLASIGRWKDEFDTATARAASEVLGEFDALFGYGLAAAPDAIDVS